MSAAVLNQPAACHAVVDRDGCHWMTHGDSAPVVPSSNFLPSPIAHVTVHSMRHPRRVHGLAHVMLESVNEPFNLAMRLTPGAARALAANLLAAAGRAEEVQAVLAPLGGKPC